jgi:RHS repeat-associated protein
MELLWSRENNMKIRRSVIQSWSLDIRNFTRQGIALILGIALCIPLIAQAGSWGDGQPEGVRESSSTDFLHPGRLASDGNVQSYWAVSSGSQSGWIERYWAAECRIAGIVVDASLPSGVQLEVSGLGSGTWTAIPGARIEGPFDGQRWLEFPGELLPSRRILLRINGPDAASARLYEAAVTERSGPDYYGKITPKNFTFNQKAYISIEPSRLWDGVIDDAWYEPLWSIPYEVLQTEKESKPDSIFPPYLGHPTTPGEIIWELDGSRSIEVIKAFFLDTYKSLSVQFWNGSAWSPATELSGDKGWARISLPQPIQTSRVRFTFPKGWERARAIGEVELWGSGTGSERPLSLPLPPAATDGSRWLTVDADQSRDLDLELILAGLSSLPLSVQWNSQPLTLAPRTWVGGQTIYRTTIDRFQYRAGPQFLKVADAQELLAINVRPAADPGRIDLGWPWNDGQYGSSEAGPGSPLIQVQNRSWPLSGGYQLEKLRIHAAHGMGLSFFTAKTGQETPIAWNQTGEGWWEADLGGRSADTLLCRSSTAWSIEEIELYGSSLAAGKPRLEIWWPPKAGVVSVNPDGASIIGWMGGSSDQPTIGSNHPRQQDHLFWLPLKDMGLTPGEEVDAPVRLVHGSVSVERRYPFRWKDKKTPGSLDQGTELVATQAVSLTLSGAITDKQSRLFIQGQEISLLGTSYAVPVTLSFGYQTLRVEFFSKNLKRLLQAYEKPVWKPFAAPSLVIDQPPGDYWSQATGLSVSGRAGNGVGIAVSRGGTAVPLSGQRFQENFALLEGTQTITYAVTDAAGQNATASVNILRDKTAPLIQILEPIEGQFLDHSPFAVRVTSPSDERLWWKFNDEPWTPGSNREVVRSDSLPDGYYRYEVQAQDRAGNLSLPASVTFWVDVTDPLPFVVSSNVSGWTSNNRPTVSFFTTDATTGVDHYEYRLDGGLWSTVTSPFKVPTLADGIRSLTIAAVDRAGNRRDSSLSLSIDTSAPPAPADFRLIPGTDQIQSLWTGVNDGEGFQTYRIEREPAWSDGIRILNGTPYGPQAYIDPSLPLKSDYSYRIWAVDRAGNQSAASGWLNAIVGIASEAINPAEPAIIDFNQVSVAMPAGAAAQDVIAIQVNEVPRQAVYAEPENPIVSKVFEFTVVRSSATGDTVTTHADFLKDLNVTIAYDPAVLPAGYDSSDLKPFYYDMLWGRWVPISRSFVDPAARTVSFSTNHFSDFSIQATKASDLSPNELRNIAFSPFGTKVTHASISISPESGAASTSFTELFLPGKNGHDLTVKRVYDTSTAIQDADTTATTGKDGSSPWKVGAGWRLQFPALTWTSNGLWARGVDGASFSFGQASIQSQGDKNDQILAISMASHEGGDIELTLSFRKKDVSSGGTRFFNWISGTIPREFDSASLYMKDGRVINFDTQGRVSSILDSSRIQTINFSYTDTATIITDSMGRVITLTNESGQVSSMSVKASSAAGAASFPNGISYTFNADGTLAEAKDVHGRVWSYTYGSYALTSTNVLKEPPTWFTQPTPTTTSAILLQSASGLGIGTQKVSYIHSPQIYEDAQGSYTWTITRDRVIGSEVSVFNAINADTSVTPLRKTNTSIAFLTPDGKGQFVADTSVVADGRIITTTIYGRTQNSRMALSSAPEAIRNEEGCETGSRPVEKEWVTFTTSIERQTAENVTIDTIVQEWEPSKLRLTSSEVTRSTLNKKRTEYEYDLWGNFTKITEKRMVSGALQPVLVTTSTYYGQFTILPPPALPVEVDYSQGYTLPSGVILARPSGGAPLFRALLASQKTSTYSYVIQVSNTPSILNQFEAYTYTNSGQMKEKYVAGPSGVWANSSYEYETAEGSTKGLLIRSRAPAKTSTAGRQVTEYTYDYTRAQDYRVTTIRKDLVLEAERFRVPNVPPALSDLVERQAFDLLQGLPILSIDARGYATKKSYDDLGRVTETLETPDDTYFFSDFPTDTYSWSLWNVKTSVVYDDEHGPKATVTDVLGLETTYTFDSLGRLAGVAKVNKTLSALAPQNATKETVSTALTYDAFDQVVTMKGPFSDLEPGDNGRSLETLVTTFTYDAQGRLTSRTLPGATKTQTTSYDDATNTVTSVDEDDVTTTTINDFDGRPISVSKIFSSAWSTAKTIYDGKGRVVATIDPMGRLSTISYNAWGVEDTIVGTERKTLAWESATSLKETAGDRLTIKKSYFNDGSLRQTDYTDSSANVLKSESLNVNGLGMILSQSVTATATVSIVTSFTYDKAGNKLFSILQYTSDATWKNKNAWAYDSHNRVLYQDTFSSASAPPSRTSYAYDAAGNRTRLTDPRGNAKNSDFVTPKYSGDFTMEMSYDMLGRLIEGRLPQVPGQVAKGQVQFLYTGRGDPLKRKEVDGVTTTYAYSLTNTLLSETTSATGTASTLSTSYTYTSAGRLYTTSRPEGVTINTYYDVGGNLASEGNDDLGYTDYEYDIMGNKAKVYDGKDNTVSYLYNPEGMVTQTTDQLSNIWYTEYDILNSPLKTTAPDRSTRTFKYDQLGRLVAETTPWGASFSYAYDAAGNQIEAKDGRGTTFTRTFSADNRLLSDDAAPATSVPPSTSVHEITTYSYDEAGYLISAYNGNQTQYNLENSTYRPHPFGMVTSINQTASGGTLRSTFGYDVAQRFTSIGTPDGKTVNYQYDKLGRMGSFTQGVGLSGNLTYVNNTPLPDTLSLGNGIIKDWTFEAGRISDLVYDKGSTHYVSYENITYDLAGNIRFMNTNKNAIADSFTYDQRNMLKQADENGLFRKTPEESAGDLSYGNVSRDIDGQKILVFSSDSTFSTGIQLDTAAQSLGAFMTKAYIIQKIELEPEPDNRQHRVRTQDLAVYVSMTNTAAQGSEDPSWTPVPYHATKDEDTGVITIIFNERIQAKYVKVTTIWDDRDEENLSFARNEKAFKNDDAFKLMRVWVLTTSRTQLFDYNVAGNRSIVSTGFSSQRGYDYAANSSGVGFNSLLTWDHIWHYFYDGNGNQVARAKKIISATTYDPSDEYWTYQYDLHNRLTGVLHGTEKVATYSYDAAGLLVTRTDEKNKLTRYAYSPGGKLIYEQKEATAAGLRKRSFVYSQNTLVGWSDTDDNGRHDYYTLTDHLGSVTAITDTTGTKVWGGEYDAFGTISGSVGRLDFDGIFTGKLIDPATGLYYYNARWYDPETGRFITEDPARDGSTWYAYCGNNPINFTDPTGLIVDDIVSQYKQQQTPWRDLAVPGTTTTMRYAGCYITFSANVSYTAGQTTRNPGVLRPDADPMASALASTGFTRSGIFTTGLTTDSFQRLQNDQTTEYMVGIRVNYNNEGTDHWVGANDIYTSEDGTQYYEISSTSNRDSYFTDDVGTNRGTLGWTTIPGTSTIIVPVSQVDGYQLISRTIPQENTDDQMPQVESDPSLSYRGWDSGGNDDSEDPSYSYRGW